MGTEESELETRHVETVDDVARGSAHHNSGASNVVVISNLGMQGYNCPTLEDSRKVDVTFITKFTCHGKLISKLFQKGRLGNNLIT